MGRMAGNWIFFIGGLIMCIGAIGFGLYMGLWVCFIGGIVQVVEAIKADPVNAMDIALGILRFVCASVVGWISFAILWIPGSAMVQKA